MDITNKDKYYNSIYKAVVVNVTEEETNDQSAKVQIYIPAVHYRYEKQYEEYIKSDNKESSPYKDLFPWAITLIDELEAGCLVYGSYIDNINDSYIILGLVAGSVNKGKGPNKDGIGGSDYYEINGKDLLNYCMPIILNNELSIPIDTWPDNIPMQINGRDTFGYINPNDNGSWSIGLIQWHATRAFTCLAYIATKDSNWKSRFSDQSIDLVKDLEAHLNAGATNTYSNKYNVFIPGVGSIAYNGIRNMLISDIGKSAQLEHASEDIASHIKKLQNEFGLTNPAMIIFLADIMNQYGEGINNSSKHPNLKGCITKAVNLQSSNSSMITQFETFYTYWMNAVNNAYETRRSNTRQYILQLEEQGKLATLTLCDIGELSSLKYVPEIGEYLWPVPASDRITAYWGDGSMKYNYTFNYNSTYKSMGYSSGAWHNGLDIGGSTPGVDGDKLIAVGSGKVAHITTGGVRHQGDITTANPVVGPSQGNAIVIQMDKNPNHYFAYMHLCKPPTLKVGDKVNAGDVVGYMGSTGGSTATHLHIGLHIGAAWPDKNTQRTTRIDPLPYFGKRANS